MTEPTDLLEHAMGLFTEPESGVAEVRDQLARRQRNQKLAAGAVVVAIWLVIGVVALALRSPDDPVPIQPPPPSPTVSPGSVDALGWPYASQNLPADYSWGSGCTVNEKRGCVEGFMHNAWNGGSGRMSITIDGDHGVLLPHEGTSIAVFGYEGGHLVGIPGDSFATGGARASCEQWMVDIQGTTVTIKLCARPGAQADEVAEAHEIIESIRVENPVTTNDLGFRLIFTLTTDTWDSG